MGITASSQHDRVFDLGTLLHDAAVKTASFAGEIATVAKVIDFGGVTAQGVVNVAYTRFDFVVDVRAADSGTGDEQYLFVLQLSNDTNGNGTLFEAADAVDECSCPGLLRFIEDPVGGPLFVNEPLVHVKHAA